MKRPTCRERFRSLHRRLVAFARDTRPSAMIAFHGKRFSVQCVSSLEGSLEAISGSQQGHSPYATQREFPELRRTPVCGTLVLYATTRGELTVRGLSLRPRSYSAT